MISVCLVVLVCFHVNHGSVIITVDTSESRDQTSGANVTELVLLVQQDLSASRYLHENQPIFS